MTEPDGRATGPGWWATGPEWWATGPDWWATLDLSSAPGDAPAAFCADLRPESLLAAYRHGLFPLPADGLYGEAMNEARWERQVAAGAIAAPAGDPDAYRVAWWSPDPRPVIPADRPRLGRRLARRLRSPAADPGRWTTTADHAFTRVVDACADGRRPHWLTEELRASLGALHAAGRAHSAEVWDGPELIGGVFGIRVGRVLSLDSMFGHRPDAARVAVADLAARFTAVGGLLLDAQWDSPHVRTLGAHPLARGHYLPHLRTTPEATTPPRTPLPASRLGRT